MGCAPSKVAVDVPPSPEPPPSPNGTWGSREGGRVVLLSGDELSTADCVGSPSRLFDTPTPPLSGSASRLPISPRKRRPPPPVTAPIAEQLLYADEIVEYGSEVGAALGVYRSALAACVAAGDAERCSAARCYLGMAAVHGVEGGAAAGGAAAVEAARAEGLVDFEKALAILIAVAAGGEESAEVAAAHLARARFRWRTRGADYERGGAISDAVEADYAKAIAIHQAADARDSGEDDDARAVARAAARATAARADPPSSPFQAQRRARTRCRRAGTPRAATRWRGRWRPRGRGTGWRSAGPSRRSCTARPWCCTSGCTTRRS